MMTVYDPEADWSDLRAQTKEQLIREHIQHIEESRSVMEAMYRAKAKIDNLRAENKRLADERAHLRAALRTEHFSSNGSSVYMEGPPEHDRSIARCRHPLCIALKLGNAKDG